MQNGRKLASCRFGAEFPPKGSLILNKKFSLSITISLIALTAAVTFILTMWFSMSRFNLMLKEVDRLSGKYQRLEELDALVQREYYTDVSQDDIIDGMLAGYVAGLDDRYSMYRPEKEMEAFEDSNTGVYTGIGVTVQKTEENEALIVEISEGGAAEKAGLLPDDRIIAVNGTSVKEDYEKTIGTIASEEGTTVIVRIRRASSGTEEDFTLTRSKIDETTVSGKMLEHRVGYIRITKFRSVSVQQFESVFHDLRGKGAEGFIFDVRENGGGILSALESIVDPLLPEGELAFSYDKAGNATAILKSDSESIDLPYVVLVNGHSASAAELFACVMRDYGGAVLVGEKTFGKGVMQTSYELSSGGVTLTTATYATGKTPCYHGIGLEPDILSVPDPESEEDTQLNDAQQKILELINA